MKPEYCYQLIPIAGTSNMKPPYYKIVNMKNRNEIENFYRELLSRPRVYYLTPIDNDVDDCLEIHIKPSSDKCYLKETTIDCGSTVQDVDEQMGKLEMKGEMKCKRKVSNYENRNVVHQSSDEGGGGEPLMLINEDRDVAPENELHSPYTFLKTWNAISKDETYTKHAEVLRRLNMNRIIEGA